MKFFFKYKSKHNTGTVFVLDQILQTDLISLIDSCLTC